MAENQWVNSLAHEKGQSHLGKPGIIKKKERKKSTKQKTHKENSKVFQTLARQVKGKKRETINFIRNKIGDLATCATERLKRVFLKAIC